MATLTCDDFIRNGFWSGESCCPYCHEDEHYLYESASVVDSPIEHLNASLCCYGQTFVKRLSQDDWIKASQ